MLGQGNVQSISLNLKGRKPRVAILTNFPADFVSFSGGVETATAALLEGLRLYQDEFEFYIISGSSRLPGDVDKERDGFKFYYIGTLMRPRIVARFFKARQQLHHLSPDLVHSQGNMALALATVTCPYPSVYTVHGVLRDEAKKRTGWEYWSASVDALIERLVIHRFNAFICISSYATRFVGTRRPTFSIPNAVRSHFFNGTLARQPSHRVLLFVGVLAPLKRPRDLLLAHADLRQEFPDLETLFCGGEQDKAYARALRETVANRSIEGVSFLGTVDQSRLRDLMSQATALVLPSTQENSPMVIAEAMAAGLPVVATRVGGIPDLVRDGETGFLYEPGDVSGLTLCIRKLLSDLTRCENMGRRAKEFASAYDPARVAKMTVAAYRRLIHEESI